MLLEPPHCPPFFHNVQELVLMAAEFGTGMLIQLSPELSFT